MRRVSISALVGAAAALLAMNAHAGLVSAEGGEVVSDSTLNVTWANVVATGVDWSSSSAPGSAQAWIASLNAADYAGFNNWQLATGDGTQTTSGTGSGASTSTTANQLAYLFINELGNSSPNQTKLGTAGAAFNTTNTGTLPGGYSYSTLANALSNSGDIWSGTTESTGVAWVFSSGGSLEDGGLEGDDFDALAVRAGQVSAVPLPAAAWLMMSGLGALALLGRRRRQQLL
jgi:hypothetical protein